MGRNSGKPKLPLIYAQLGHARVAVAIHVLLYRCAETRKTRLPRSADKFMQSAQA